METLKNIIQDKQKYFYIFDNLRYDIMYHYFYGIINRSILI